MKPQPFHLSLAGHKLDQQHREQHRMNRFSRRKPPATTTDAISSSITTLATAATLGLPIPAPVGTRIYVPTLHNPLRHAATPWAPVTDAVFACYDSAAQALADYLVSERHQPHRISSAPWYVPDFWTQITGEQWRADRSHWQARERRAQDRARDAWLARRTAQQVIEELRGREGVDWAIREIPVQP